MTINPVAGPGPRPVGGVLHGGIDRWSVRLAETMLAVFAVVYAFVVVAFLVGGDDAISDNWVGWMGGITLYATLVGSLVASALGIYAGMKHGSWRAVWVGISAFPILVAILLISEFTFLE